ncbi:hypothetical protein HY212_02795 [Candidatus Pacearchaeota archaeon]|nr:hypothetical protein [Candidatus Pacearchaeota archaeon]
MHNQFCSKCSSILIPERLSSNIYALKCTKCGFYKEVKGEDLIRTDKITKKQVGQGIVKDSNEYADYAHKCKKCGYGKAQIIDEGVFYSDEDDLILLKCGKCGFSEKIGRKTS